MDTRRYNDQIRYVESELAVNSVISDKNLTLHKRLYDVALSRLLESLGISESDCHIKEIPAKSCLDPSFVTISSNIFPFDVSTYSLRDFWPYHVATSIRLSNLPQTFLEAPSEIVSKDFVKGQAKIQNRMSLETMSVPLDAVPSNIGLSETIDLDRMSFSSKMNN